MSVQRSGGWCKPWRLRVRKSLPSRTVIVFVSRCRIPPVTAETYHSVRVVKQYFCPGRVRDFFGYPEKDVKNPYIEQTQKKK